MLERFAPTTQGAILLVIGISIFGFSDNLTLLVSDQVSVGQFHFSRSLIAVFMIIGLGRVFGLSVIPRLWKPIIIRTIFMVTSMLLYFGVMPMMPIAEAGAGLFTSPIFVLIFSAFFFKEQVGWRKIVAVIIGSCGVLMVLQPSAEGFTFYQIIPVMAGACYAIGSMITYRYLREESSLAILLSFIMSIGFCGFLISVLLTLFPVAPHLVEQAPFLFKGWQRVDGAFWLWMFVIAAGASAALSLMTRAYQLAQTSYAAIFEYAYLISVGLFSWLLWGIVPNLISALGILLIISAGIIIVLAPQKQRHNALNSEV